MSRPSDAGKLALTELLELKRRGQPIVMVTAYDYPSGRLADEAGIDLVLVHVWRGGELVYGADGRPERYTADERSREALAELAREAGGLAIDEADADSAVRAARRFLASGPTAVVREEVRQLALTPYAVVAAALLVSVLFAQASAVRRRRVRREPFDPAELPVAVARRVAAVPRPPERERPPTRVYNAANRGP